MLSPRNPAAVDEVWKIFDGFDRWALPTAKVCQVGWSGPHQGFQAHVERYRNSPVMHKSALPRMETLMHWMSIFIVKRCVCSRIVCSFPSFVIPSLLPCFLASPKSDAESGLIVVWL